MTEKHARRTDHPAGEPTSRARPPERRTGIQAWGIAAFTMSGLLFGAALGGAIEGDAAGVLHFGVPCAVIAFGLAKALVSPPSSSVTPVSKRRE
jgi:hypothetical protein